MPREDVPELKMQQLETLGFSNVAKIHWNLPTAPLYEEITRRNEGLISADGPAVMQTGEHTGRSPKDKFIVEEPGSKDLIWWEGDSKPFAPERFALMTHRILAYMQNKEVFVQDCYAGADPDYRLRVRVITEKAWHNLFGRTMFIVPTTAELAAYIPDYTIIHAPDFHASPNIDGTHSKTFILMNFATKLILIGGTSYAGEIKKSVFSLLNFILPQKRVLSMHCSANIGDNGDVALFFGLSGTGKTTLSTDPNRLLIGDDEHGWSDNGIFNFEGGCYAKVIRLSEDSEPDIYSCTRRFGTILENVVMDPHTRQLDLDDDSLTENTRAAYPITHLDSFVPSGMGGHPKHIFMLTCDAFGVLPPIARLTPEQAMYHFVSGYTAKVAGTERGLGREPEATFSPCFGAPFMVMHPGVYANLLRERMLEHNVTCWLVNTGWSGGPYGVGKRMSIGHTRALINAALDGRLENTPMAEDPIFRFQIPVQCPDVPGDVLQPRKTWSDKAAYDDKARRLAQSFHEHFKPLSYGMEAAVQEAGPRVG
jgi:phosphoenolpyruvate carboxykinase (ATP)